MQKAIFLDRDGVINREKGSYITNVADFEILPTSLNAIKIFKEKGYLLFVITNQGGIAKGLYTHADLQAMHDKMVNEFKAIGVEFTEIYYCPHHPDYMNCICRKPDSSMLERAIAKYNIDVTKSIMIGDRERDYEAAGKVGLKGILIESNSDIKEIAERY